MPRVSVLLTCYNHLAYLPAALDSVRAQTFRDFEIIALDDGSTDGSREYLSEQTDIRLFLNPVNLGTYGTLNVGLEVAEGEFIAVLNDDDLWAPDKLQKQVELMDANPTVGLCHTGGYFINGPGERTPGNPLGFAWPTFTTGPGLFNLVFENKIIASAALARTQVLRDLGGFNEHYFGSGDWEMWWRVAEVSDLGFVPDELTAYRVHGANASHKLEKIWRDDEHLREFFVERINMADFGDRLAEAHGFNWAALGTVKMLNGKTAESRAAYRSSIHYQPRRWKTYARYALTFAGRSAFRKLL